MVQRVGRFTVVRRDTGPRSLAELAHADLVFVPEPDAARHAP
jgi:hypothetical protein